MKNLSAAFAGLCATAALAQDRPQDAYSGSLEASHSYAGEAGIRLGQTQLGDIDSQRTRVEYKGVFNPGAEVSWGIGVAYGRWDFGLPGGAPLPPNLHSIALPLSASWRINDRWQAFGELSPGVYGDLEDVRSEDLNAPFIGGVGFSFSPDLQVFLTVSIDGRRDVPVIGGPGLRWKFAEQWTLQLTLPRPQIQYRPSESWLFHVGGEIGGGAYHLHKRFGTDRGLPSLDGQIANYREIRVGTGVRWGGNAGFNVAAEAGWMIDRRFVFDDLRLQFNGDASFYGQLSLNYRY